MAKLKEYKIKYIRLADKFTLGKLTVEPQTEIEYANTPLQGLKVFNRLNEKNEYELLELYEDGKLIEVPKDNRGGKRREGITKKQLTYYADLDLVPFLEEKGKGMSEYINQLVREKMNNLG